jgi:hypothetical protein
LQRVVVSSFWRFLGSNFFFFFFFFFSLVDLAKLFAWKPEDRLVSWTRRDAILYALGVGVTDQLCYLYEKDENFKALPTLVCATSFKGTSSEVIDFNANSGSFPV